jgi:acetyl esterase/lipase
MYRLFVVAALAVLLPAMAQAQDASLPTYADIAYAPAEPAASKGHLLDLYLPAAAKTPVPVVIWTGGSAWRGDQGKETAGWLVPELTKHGYAVAGVSIRSTSQVIFPGQVHDIKAAIRWLRSNAARYGLDGNRIAIIGDSSGGWTTAMAALTGDAPELEGSVGVTGVSSAVQAAIAFYPPSDFLLMDDWALGSCKTAAAGGGADCHDNADSPESQLVGCALQQCPEKVKRADPARYISEKDPPIMIFHGEADRHVPYVEGMHLYQALNKACHDAIFISFPKADHGPAIALLTDEKLNQGATIRSTAVAGCTVKNAEFYRPGMATIVDFLDANLKGKIASK